MDNVDQTYRKIYSNNNVISIPVIESKLEEMRLKVSELADITMKDDSFLSEVSSSLVKVSVAISQYIKTLMDVRQNIIVLNGVTIDTRKIRGVILEDGHLVNFNDDISKQTSVFNSDTVSSSTNIRCA